MTQWFDRDLVGDTSGHDAATRCWLAASARTALASPVNWTGLMVALIGAMAWTPDTLLLAPITFLVAFARALLDGDTQAESISRARARPARLPSAGSFMDPQARTIIERLGRAREEIHTAVATSPRGAAFDVGGPLAAVPNLERDVLILAARVDYLGRFLSSTPAAGLRSEMSRLEASAAEEPRSEGMDIEDTRRRISSCRVHMDKLAALDRRRTALLQTADDVLQGLEQVPAAIAHLQLDRLVACDSDPVGGGEKARALIESFEALAGAARKG